MGSSEKDVKIRKAHALRTCHQMKNIWNSKISRKFIIRLMIATVDSVLLYGCETWTLTNSLFKKLDGTYTTILRMVLNFHWTNNIKNEILYGALEILSNNIRRRRICRPLPTKRRRDCFASGYVAAKARKTT